MTFNTKFLPYFKAVEASTNRQRRVISYTAKGWVHEDDSRADSDRGSPELMVTVIAQDGDKEPRSFDLLVQFSDVEDRRDEVALDYSYEPNGNLYDFIDYDDDDDKEENGIKEMLADLEEKFFSAGYEKMMSDYGKATA